MSACRRGDDIDRLRARTLHEFAEMQDAKYRDIMATMGDGWNGGEGNRGCYLKKK